MEFLNSNATTVEMLTVKFWNKSRGISRSFLQIWIKYILVLYSSIPNKRARPNKRAGWNFDKKSNKRAVLNKHAVQKKYEVINNRARRNFDQNTKKSAGWNLLKILKIMQHENWQFYS